MVTFFLVEEFNKDETVPVPASTNTLKEVNYYNWAAHHKRISTVETYPYVSKAISDKAVDLHKNKTFTIPRPINRPVVEDLIPPQGYVPNESPFETNSFKFYHGTTISLLI